MSSVECRTCSLTVECVLLLQNVFSTYTADMRVFKHLMEVKRQHPWVGTRPQTSLVSGLLAAGSLTIECVLLL